MSNNEYGSGFPEITREYLEKWGDDPSKREPSPLAGLSLAEMRHIFDLRLKEQKAYAVKMKSAEFRAEQDKVLDILVETIKDIRKTFGSDPA